MKIVVVDYGMGNLHSVYTKFRKLGLQGCVSAEYAVIEQADALILPGVGHYGRAMDKLHRLGLVNLLNDRVLGERVPVMGICLGMQLFMEHSEEGDAAGLGWVRGNTVRFRLGEYLNERSGFKVPHIGWNSVEPLRAHPIGDGLSPDEAFYFVHSFHVSLVDPADALHQTTYGYPFVSAVQRDNLFGFQYHPEKSQDAGLTLFKNFVHYVNAVTHVPTPRDSVPVVAE